MGTLKDTLNCFSQFPNVLSRAALKYYCRTIWDDSTVWDSGRIEGSGGMWVSQRHSTHSAVRVGRIPGKPGGEKAITGLLLTHGPAFLLQSLAKHQQLPMH